MQGRRCSQEKENCSNAVFSCTEKPVCSQRSPHREPVMEDTVTVPLTDSLGSSLRPASEPTFLSVLQVLKDTFGMFLFLHL